MVMKELIEAQTQVAVGVVKEDLREQELSLWST
jgi:hypothetical protein